MIAERKTFKAASPPDCPAREGSIPAEGRAAEVAATVGLGPQTVTDVIPGSQTASRKEVSVSLQSSVLFAHTTSCRDISDH